MTENCPRCKTKIQIRNGRCFETSHVGRDYYIKGMLDIEVTCFGCGMVRRVEAGDYEIKAVAVKNEVLWL